MSSKNEKRGLSVVMLGLAAVIVVVLGVHGRLVAQGRPGRSRPGRPAGHQVTNSDVTGPRSTTTTPLLARTSTEAHLVMSLSPCARGATEFIIDGALFQIDGGFVRRYSGACRSCGTPREFLFPSRTSPSRPGPARSGSATALPHGVSAVLAGAFFTPAGQRIKDREPGRFGRARLEAVRDTHWQILAEMAEPPADRTTGPGVDRPTGRAYAARIRKCDCSSTTSIVRPTMRKGTLDGNCPSVVEETCNPIRG